MFLRFQWIAANIWCKLQFPETTVDLYLIYLLSVWTWVFTSASVLYEGKKKRNRKDLPVTVDLWVQAFSNLFWKLKLFFLLWQFVSVCNSRSSHLDIGNMVATSILLMFHGQLLSSWAYFNYWQKRHISALSSKVPFVNPHTMRRWTRVLWPEFNEKQ